MGQKYYGEHLGGTARKKAGDPRLVTIDDLYRVLRCCWCRETAYPSCQRDWQPNDPTYGQCAITAMLVYDMFGGTIRRIRTGGGTHYFNEIGGEYLDLTREQFDLYHIPVDYEPNEIMDRKYCGKNPDTRRRYQLLVQRIADYLQA
ncbi:MAG: hypothetical protein LUJ09_02355 [Firmicutes bacterium]|nr:hypothetical protein [Bacillota bacterium]